PAAAGDAIARSPVLLLLQLRSLRHAQGTVEDAPVDALALRGPRRQKRGPPAALPARARPIRALQCGRPASRGDRRSPGRGEEAQGRAAARALTARSADAARALRGRG